MTNRAPPATLDSFAADVDSTITRYTLGHERNLESLRSIKALMDKTVAEFMKTGVAFIPDKLTNNAKFHRIASDPAVVLRQYAKEAKRNIVIAEEHHGLSNKTAWVRCTCIKMEVPKNARYNQLVAGLLVIANEITDRWNVAEGLWRLDTKGKWVFLFVGGDDSEARAMFNEFVETCRTDPVFKVILQHD